MTQTITTVNTRWRGKQIPIEVTVTRITLRTVSYVGVHGAISGTVPHWQFLQDFQPVLKCKTKIR
jgi:hypothetical protein